MRLSPNPVIAATAWVYTWFFRAIPASCCWCSSGNLGILYAHGRLRPARSTGSCSTCSASTRAPSSSALDARTFLTGFVAGLIGLALSEGAYMAEIVRAGIESIDPGQTEAARRSG